MRRLESNRDPGLDFNTKISEIGVVKIKMIEEKHLKELLDILFSFDNGIDEKSNALAERVSLPEIEFRLRKE